MNTRCSKCGGYGCNVRVARGLLPFCEMAPTEKKWDGLYSSYAAALEASPVRKARWVKGGGTTGSPARFKALTS